MYEAAVSKLKPRVSSPFLEAGSVSAAILTENGNIYTGVFAPFLKVESVSAAILTKNGNIFTGIFAPFRSVRIWIFWLDLSNDNA